MTKRRGHAGSGTACVFSVTPVSDATVTIDGRSSSSAASTKFAINQTMTVEAEAQWYGTAWYCVVWRGMAWRGMAWRGVAWGSSIAWYGVAWHGMAWHGVARRGMAWPGTA